MTEITSNGKETTWADMIKSIEKNKRELSWNPALVAPVQRVSLFEVNKSSILCSSK